MASEGEKAHEEAISNGFTNDSAMMIAYERYLETSRAEPLFQDPFAEVMAGPKGKTLSEDFTKNCAMFGFGSWPEFHQTWTAVRTKFLDDFIVNHAKSGKFTQLVNCGAGMDTRSYRIPEYSSFSSGCFDVDMPAVNGPKAKFFEKVLGSPKAHCELRTLDLDFLDKEHKLKAALSGCGNFDSEKPTVFVAEGLIMYLGAEGKFKLIDDISACAAPGSVFVLNFLSADDSAVDAQKAPAFSQEEAKKSFAENGWEDLQFWKFGEEGLNFGRYDTSKFEPSRAFSFVVAVKK